MNDEIFWKIIGESKTVTNDIDDTNEQAERLKKILINLDASELLRFIVIFYECLWRAHQWKLWAIAYIGYEGCSDDSFEEFRAWLISRGRNFFEKAVEAPITAALAMKKLLPELTTSSSVWFLVAPVEAYETKVGHHPFDDLPESVFSDREPSGEKWDENSVCSQFPEICEFFGKTDPILMGD